jgi:LacI family repressor for deo operon, udp, cdd, tsx, nupC, and nupG
VYRATRTGGRSLPVIWAETDRATIWPFDSLRFDCRKATFDATQHLIDLGHRRIAMLAPGETMDWADERIDGFRQALAVNDIAEIPGSVIRAEDFSMAIERYWHKAGRSAAERLMAAETNFTAAVCANDSIALETSLLATERGLTLPDDLSLVGFDDSLEARHYDIATIQLDAALYGREAASQALRRLNEPSLPGHVDQALDCRLVLRGSMAPPRSV